MIPTDMPKDFDLVQLTPEEEALAIFDARYEKWQIKKQNDAIMEKKKALQEAIRPFSTQQLKDYVLAGTPEFILDDQAAVPFDLLAMYFANDPAFESAGYSLKKGICICGDVGVGKTELLDLFASNKRKCFHMISVFEMEDFLNEHGPEQVVQFYGDVPGQGAGPKNFFQRGMDWAFDDVGRESIIFDFGNKTDAISKILQHRYFKKVPFHSLHITTNKSPDELEKRYGDALRSRLREMFNYINYKGTDRRK